MRTEFLEEFVEECNRVEDELNEMEVYNDWKNKRKYKFCGKWNIKG